MVCLVPSKGMHSWLFQTSKGVVASISVSTARHTTCKRHKTTLHHSMPDGMRRRRRSSSSDTQRGSNLAGVRCRTISHLVRVPLQFQPAIAIAAGLLREAACAVVDIQIIQVQCCQLLQPDVCETLRVPPLEALQLRQLHQHRRRVVVEDLTPHHQARAALRQLQQR